MNVSYQDNFGFVTGGVRWALRLEGLAVLAAAVGGFVWMQGSWVLFGALFLVPDVSFAGYLIDRRVGAIAYNALHSYVGPVVLGWAGHGSLLTAIALIWAAHIGFDRALGYGLKYATAFGDTHLGRAGKGAK
jgi:hypothetical protein